MKIMARDLAEGERIPRGYGLAYHDWERDILIVYPLPFNLLAALMRRLYYRLVYGMRPLKFEAAIRRARQAAWNRGYDTGYVDCGTHMIQRMHEARRD